MTTERYTDMVVLEENIFEINPIKVKDINLEMTIVNGEIKYCRS